MKRTLAIILLFTGLNALIFWITSERRVPHEDVLTSSESKIPESVPVSPIVKEDTSRSGRSLLLGTPGELSVRIGKEIQSASARAIPSLVRLQILWREKGREWTEDWVNALSVDGDGLYAASWNHVAQGEIFRIHYQDGSQATATLHSFDPSTDIALLNSSEPGKSQPVVFSNGLSLPFGSPLLFIVLNGANEAQVFKGYLSGVTYDSLSGFPDVVSGYLRTDMRVSAVEAGGILVDIEGRLTGFLADYPSRQGTPLMLSSEEVLNVCRQLKQQGYISRSESGMRTQKLTPDLIRAFGWSEDTAGIVVTRVEKNSPADEAGIVPGDVLVELNARKVSSPGFFQSVVSRWPLEKPLVLTMKRAGGGQVIEMKLRASQQLAEEAPEQEAIPGGTEQGVASSGTDHEPEPALTGSLDSVVIDEQSREYLVLETYNPARVLFSPPLQKGDVILRVENAPGGEAAETLTAKSLLSQLEAAGTKSLLLQCYRNGESFWVTARLISAAE